jgi:peptidoglycan/LPS O-acetylase OafA/YrhL
MGLERTHDRLELPGSLRAQLHEFRHRVWSVKMAEAACAAAFGVAAAFLLMFSLDRAWDTPPWPRTALFVAAMLACAVVPRSLHRWVWKNRSATSSWG